MTGACQACGRTFRIRDGVVVFHRRRWNVATDTLVEYTWPQPACPGWGKPPGENA